MNENNQTVGQKYRGVVHKYQQLFHSSEPAVLRKDSAKYQAKLTALIQEFTSIQTIVERLSLFSDNESLDEINVNYIPFANVNYYLGTLYLNYLLDLSGRTNIDSEPDKLIHKPKNLAIAQNRLINFLVQLQSFGKSVLSPSQTARLNSFKDLYHPTFDEIVSYSNNPALKRADKIANFKLEKELASKLDILNEYYDKSTSDDDEESIFTRFDEETIKSIFVDQLRLHSIHAFSNLELITMESQVLSNRPRVPPNSTPDKQQQLKQQQQEQIKSNASDYGYTPRLESLPFKQKNVGDLVSKQGKILQPFTITSDKQELKRKVFGTGQVLPSMSVEEYLDYELANGKMMKEEVKDSKGSEDDDSDAYDSDTQLEKRQWDDWKDENPKGSGNMGANLG